MKKVAVLGSTGSIGVQTLDVIRKNPDRFRVWALCATGKNRRLLERQAQEFKPAYLGTTLNVELELPPEVKHLKGKDSAIIISQLEDVDIFVIALSGLSGVLPTYYAASSGKRVALSNKESVVSAGEIIMERAKKTGTEIIPIDSEHSAVFQCLLGQDRKALKRLILTASGGPFRNHSIEEMERVTPEEALSHPVWNMGAKISVDSATLMNKGLEVIEASVLFGVPADAIDVVIHPEGIIHSMVEFTDGSSIAQLGPADMRIPISFALGFPERVRSGAGYLDLTSVGTLSFEKPDFERFPLLKLAYTALKTGKSAPAVLNAANETAVEAFLEGKIKFTDIHRVVKSVMEKIVPSKINSIDDVILIHKKSAETALSIINSLN